jgi:hypothetical protein
MGIAESDASFMIVPLLPLNLKFTADIVAVVDPNGRAWAMRFAEPRRFRKRMLCHFRSNPRKIREAPAYQSSLAGSTRPFLGASNIHAVIPGFASFCELDDLDLKSLNAAGKDQQHVVQRPIPIWSAAVNVTDSSQIGLQERKAGCFCFTPLRCGYEIVSAGRPVTDAGSDSRETPRNAVPAYAMTRDHGSAYGETNEEFERETLTVGKVMAISGAAFSSNTGASTKPEKALLLTLLGFRLGNWLPNPANAKANESSSACSPWETGLPYFVRRGVTWLDRLRDVRTPLILKEAFSRCDVSSDAVYVTDGGHFDNLGIYEMIRRRVRLIVATDAGCDPHYHFSDLLNLQTKVRTDFGVDIRIEALDELAVKPGQQFAQRQVAVWRIIYSRDARGEPQDQGLLVYCKSTMTGAEDADLLAYKNRVPTFPHLSTVNQWFAESTFEAYRALGLHIGREAARVAAINGLGQSARSDSSANLISNGNI